MKKTLRTGSLALAFALFLTATAFAQVQVSGTVTDRDTGEALPGASVILEGTTLGAATNTDGEFAIPSVPSGSYSVTASFVGYGAKTVRIAVGAANVSVDFELEFVNQSLQSLEIFASRAVDRKTPVAYTNIDKVQIQRELGSRDAPLILNTVPSVYATAGGGGSGDARVNVRGFNQRNVAIMINGVPVNDMENGWVYWSNWDGIGDATTSLQLQRGLSATNVTVPSIGGTMNVITDPAALSRSVSVKQEFGNDGFLKTTAFASTGLIDGKYALTAGGVRKTGDGLYAGTWTDAWAYYFAGAYNINAKHRLDFYAVGAPQRHGQNLYMQNIATYDEDFARDHLDDDVLAFDDDGNGTADIFDTFGLDDREYNQNESAVSPSYSGQQARGDDTFDRHDSSFLNERENFFHKPQVNLNWYAQFTDDLLLSTVVYYSGGAGGGTGTAGDILWDYSGPSRRVNYDGTIAINQGSATRKGAPKTPGVSNAILRNSRNNQWTIGAITKAKLTINENTTLEAGLDWRTAEIDHYREVRDLLGGSHFVDNGDEFSPNKQVGLGDKIIYNFTNTVDWYGAFAQGEYVKDQLSTYGMAGISMVKYTSTNHFMDDGTGNELFFDPDNITGFQVKGGALYNVNDQVAVFANAGYVSKVPIVDGVINDEFGALNDDPQNEKFTSLEAGLNFRSEDRSFAAKVNAYYTKWEDRTLTRSESEAVGDDGLITINGLNALHQGLEAEVAYQPHPLVRFDGAASVGDWVYTDDVTDALYIADFNDPSLNEELDLYIKDVKVGNQPQTQFALAVSVFPIDGMYAKVIAKHFTDMYAAFSPLSRDDPTDRAQSWKTPSYTVLDVHVGYDLPIKTGRFDVQVFANVFNVLDELYIQDASDNSPFNGFGSDPSGKNHRADDAELFLGLSRTFTVGTTVTFR